MQGSPTFLTGPTGLELLATATEAEARAAIGAMANTAPEIITNANGTAYRWPNGLQICRGNGLAQTTTFAYGSVWGTQYASTWTYPAAFATTPAVFGAGVGTSGRWIGLNVSNESAVQYTQFSFSSQTFTIESKLIAIGIYTP